METKSCELCRAEIIKVKQGKHISVECSYCGEPYDEISIEDIITEDGEDYE